MGGVEAVDDLLPADGGDRVDREGKVVAFRRAAVEGARRLNFELA